MKREYAEYLSQKIKNDYNLTIADYYSSIRPHPWKEMEFLARNYLKDGDKVLDLGCGGGRFYEAMRGKNIEYVGVDNSERFIEIAKERYPDSKFLSVDAKNLPFPENHFDKAYAIALLHHIPSKEFRLQVLNEAKRVLKKQGLLILTIWNLWQKQKTRDLIFKYGIFKIFGKSKLDFKDILMDWEGEKGVYFHCFTKKELEGLIKKVGFKIIKKGEILVDREKTIRSALPNSNFYIIAQKT